MHIFKNDICRLAFILAMRTRVTPLFILLCLSSSSGLSDTKEKCEIRPSNYEVRAVLMPCHPNPHHLRCFCGQVKKLQSYDSKVCKHDKLQDCTKKVVILVKIFSVGQTNCDKQYIVVDEVYDCQTDTKQKLLYPYVLKIKQEPILQTYRLDCEGSLRERCRAIESVREDGFEYPRLRKKTWKIPWAQCSNELSHTIQKSKRDVPNFGKTNSRRFSNHSSNYGNFNHKICPDDTMDEERNWIYNFDDMDEIKNYITKSKGEEKSENSRTETSSYKGYDSKTGHPSSKYRMSSPPKHNCYRNYGLGNMRYYIYKLQEPIVKHHFSMEIFEKHYEYSGKVQWNLISGDKPVYLGTYDTDSWGSNNAFVASYSSREPPLRNFALAFDNIRLLIPELPHLRGGPEKFLVVPESMFIRKQECFDSPGVHYGAHGKYVTKSSCIQFPPDWFWCQDHKRELQGLRGNYFLKNFAKLPTVPIHNTTDCFQNLTFFYEGPHQSYIKLEIKADFNMMLKPHSSAVITEVYVDGTPCDKTDITVKVTNTGLVYAAFYVFLTDCPLSLPAGFSNIATSSAVIPPQQQHIFALTVLFPLPKKAFYCSVDVKNYRDVVLAFRRIRFQKNDRCICIWHCCCTCLDTDGGLKCRPLPIDHYNAAGFYGGLPVASNYVISTSFTEEYLFLLFNLCLTMTVLLLVLGVLKAVLGLCYPPIGRFGLEWYLGLPKSIDRYYESNLTMKPVQYNKLKWPTSSGVNERTQTTSTSTEFTLNVFFFLLYPLVLLHAIVVKMFTPEYGPIDREYRKASSSDQPYRSRRKYSSLNTSPTKSCLKRKK